MRYTLMHAERPLVHFQWNESLWTAKIECIEQGSIVWLPKDFGDLDSWLHRRAAKENRWNMEYLYTFHNEIYGNRVPLLLKSRGLSMNDLYWIASEEDRKSGLKYADISPYRHSTNQAIFEGLLLGQDIPAEADDSANPECTTQGSLAKAWLNGIMYKTGSCVKRIRAVNEGYEPYNEYYASCLAELMGIEHCPYDIEMYKGELVSTCPAFTDEGTGYEPIYSFGKDNDLWEIYTELYEMLGEDFAQAFEDMMVFDAVIMNEDRHYGNFGFLIDHSNNTVIKPAPLFDHGFSFLTYLPPDKWGSPEHIEKYKQATHPRFGLDFMSMAEPYLKPRHKGMLLKILNTPFPRHPKYNLPEDRLIALDRITKENASELLARLEEHEGM